MLKFHESAEIQRGELHCPVCSSTATHAFLEVDKDTDRYQVFHCDDCSAKFSHPFPNTDYSSHTDSKYAIRSYVESIADIDGLVANIIRVLDTERPGKLLDIGCGFGFVIDAVRRTTNWQVKGVEPSAYGKIGARYLKLDILTRPYNGPEDVGCELFDLIHVSDVIEHIAEPQQFVRSIKSSLAIGGTLVFTTPNADAIQPQLDPFSLLALLSPGSHTILFSPRSLEFLLKQVGLAHVVVETQIDHLVAFASQQPIQFKSNLSLGQVLETYYRRALEAVESFSFVSDGLAYRFFKRLVCLGRYEEAENVFRRIHLVAPANIDALRRIEDFADAVPYSACGLFYFRGMHILNSVGDSSFAAEFFRKAFALGLKKIQIAPSICVEESHLLWHAKFHEGLCHYRLGRKQEARAAIEMIQAQFNGAQLKEGVPLPSDPEFHERVRVLYKDIQQLT